jgi:hypothetical protein
MTDTPTRPAPQQEQAARFTVRGEGYSLYIKDTATGRNILLTAYCTSTGRPHESNEAYARTIAAALNASPPKEAK